MKGMRACGAENQDRVFGDEYIRCNCSKDVGNPDGISYQDCIYQSFK